MHSTIMKQEVQVTVSTCCCAGENSIIIVGGANQASWQLSESAKQLVQRAGAVLLQREIPEAVNTEVAQLARSAGVPVILDAGGVEAPVNEELLSNVTMLSPNETELARLTGCPTDSLQQVGAAGAAVTAPGSECCSVTGSQGVWLPCDRVQALSSEPHMACVMLPCCPWHASMSHASHCSVAPFVPSVLHTVSWQRMLCLL